MRSSTATLASDSNCAPTTRKILARRITALRSQRLRLAFQLAFLVLNVWIGVRFYLWVHQFETAGARVVERPAGVEGWLPVAALMNLRYLALTFAAPEIHPAGMFLLVAFLAMSFLFRKAFCSWLCPVGTLSEYLWKFGRNYFKRNFNLPRWLDILLRSLKYVLLSLFLYIIGSMGASSLEAFLASPYGIIADVKMLNFFRYMSVTTASAFGILIVLSIFIQNFWCRYLCPYGALMGLASLVSPTRIERNSMSCIDCSKCAKACPSHLPVDKLVQIRSAECTGCLECLAICPIEDALQTSVGIPLMKYPTSRLSLAAIVFGIAIVFFGVVGFAKATDHWQTKIPYSTYQELVPRAKDATHPRR